MSRRCGHGFSLLELLLVLVVMALVAGVAALVLWGGGEREVTREADRFVAELERVRDAATLSGWPWGLALFAEGNRAGYQWLRRDTEGWTSTAPDGGPGRQLWPETLGVLFTVEGAPVLLDEQVPEPQVWLMGDGEVTPFEVRLVAAGTVLSLQVDGLGAVRRERRDEP